MRRVDLDHFDVVLFAIEVIDALNGGELFMRDVLRPIAGSGDEQHGFGREHGGDFDVVGADAQAGRIFAEIAALHDGGDHVDGRGEAEAIVHGGEQEGLRAAAGCAGDSQFGRDRHRPRQATKSVALSEFQSCSCNGPKDQSCSAGVPNLCGVWMVSL